MDSNMEGSESQGAPFLKLSEFSRSKVKCFQTFTPRFNPTFNIYRLIPGTPRKTCSQTNILTRWEWTPFWEIGPFSRSNALQLLLEDFIATFDIRWLIPSRNNIFLLGKSFSKVPFSQNVNGTPFWKSVHFQGGRSNALRLLDEHFILSFKIIPTRNRNNISLGNIFFQNLRPTQWRSPFWKSVHFQVRGSNDTSF